MLVVAIITIVLIAAVVISNMIVSRQSQGDLERTDCTSWAAADSPQASAPAINALNGEVALGQSLTDSNDITSHYHVFAHEIDRSEPVGLLVHLHGDGAAEFDSPNGFAACAANVAAQHNLITVIPHTPDTQQETWWHQLSVNQHWLNALVDQLITDYDLDAEKIWWSGYSGGAEMISYSLLHANPDIVTGGAIMFAGGGAPVDQDPTFEAHYQQTTPLYWVVGSNDDGTTSDDGFNAIRAVRRGSHWYEDQGFDNVHTEIVEGHDHYTLPKIDLIAEILNEQDV
ncbi:hypothetical protein [Corynebacterium lubricantis]|uniref:hypothetical protein n=1 Tax=Corynebacterium lubricantis TaxID=541095 RepID=UPI00039F1762|nr:hypothetical protein [Corynebacterium lubricantis]